MTLDRDLRNLDPRPQTRGVLYHLHLPLDDSYEAIATRYRTTVAALDAATQEHNLVPINRRPSGEAAITLPLYLELDEFSRAIEWGLLVLRDGSETLGSLCTRLRRHPLRPLADPTIVWQTPLNAELRAEVTVAMHPTASSRDPEVASLDRHPERARLPRGASVWVPFPMRFTVEQTQATHSEPTAGGAPPVGSTVELEPEWLRALRADLRGIRDATGSVIVHTQACNRKQREGLTLYRQLAKIRLLLGTIDAVGRSRDHGYDGLRGLSDAVDDALHEAHSRLIEHARENLYETEAGFRDHAALDLLRRVRDQGFRDRARSLHRDPIARPVVLQEICDVLRDAYAALLLSPSTEGPAGEALGAAVDRISTARRPDELRGESALEDVLSLVPQEDPHPSSLTGAALRSLAGTMVTGFQRSIADTQSFISALGQVGTYAGNLPGPPSLAGAVMNLCLHRAATSITTGVVDRRVALRTVEALRRSVTLSETDVQALRGLYGLEPGRTSAMTNEVVDEVLGKISSRYQAGPRWTTGLGVIAALGWVVSVSAYHDAAEQAAQHAAQHPEEAPDPGWVRMLRETINLGGLTQGAMVTLSAVAQRRAISAGLDLRASVIHSEAAGSLGTAAAWLGVGISLGSAAIALHEGNYAGTVSGGVSAAAAVLTIVGGPYVILFGLVLGIAAPMVVSAYSDELNELARTQAQVFVVRALRGLRGSDLLARVELYTGESALREKIDAAIAAWPRQSFPEIDAGNLCEVPPAQRRQLNGRAQVPFEDLLRAMGFTRDEVALCLDVHAVVEGLTGQGMDMQ